MNDPSDDTIRHLKQVLDRPDLRAEMGRAARRRFEESYLWESVIEEQYRPLLAAIQTAATAKP